MKRFPVRLGVKDVIILMLAIALSWVILFNVVTGSGGQEAKAQGIDEQTPMHEPAVTAEEELDAQIKFAEEQKEEEEKIQESNIMDRLQYTQYHTTFDRNLPQVFDYTVGGDGVDPIVTYAYYKTKDLPHPTLGTLGMEMVKTWSLENSMYNVGQRGGIDERGICQLRYAYHKPFMESQEFRDPYKNIDYCVDVYLDWYYRARLKGRSLQSVRGAWDARNTVKSRFKPLYTDKK